VAWPQSWRDARFATLVVIIGGSNGNAPHAENFYAPIG